MSGANPSPHPRWAGIITNGARERRRLRWGERTTNGARGRPCASALKMINGASHHRQWGVGWISQKIKAPGCVVALDGRQMLATRLKDNGNREVGSRMAQPGKAVARLIAGTRGRLRPRRVGHRNRGPAKTGRGIWEVRPASPRVVESGADRALIGQARAARSQVAPGGRANRPPGRRTPGKSHPPGNLLLSAVRQLHAHSGSRRGAQALRAPGRAEEAPMSGASQSRGRSHPPVARWNLRARGG